MGSGLVSALPHVVWDMGGVLYRYFTELMIEYGEAHGWPLDDLALGPTGRIPDPDYDRMLSGEISERGYLPIVVDQLASHGISVDPPRDLRQIWAVRARTFQTIEKISAAGHRQAVLTNDASRWLGDNWWESWEYAGWFDAMIDVITLRRPKPDPEPYLAAADSLGAPPNECLFVDDLPVNCRGADAVGMESFLFEIVDPAASLDQLEARLGLTEPESPQAGTA